MKWDFVFFLLDCEFSFFYIVCKIGYDRIVKLLLDCGVSKNLCIKNGKSFFFIVCVVGNLRIV